MLGDSITMPDVYCGDPQQTVDDLKGLGLNHEQYAALVEPAGKGFADEMSNWVLLGVRDAGNGITLAAYYAGNGLGYCVELFTYDRKVCKVDKEKILEANSRLQRIYAEQFK